jgi:hypothetical protein
MKNNNLPITSENYEKVDSLLDDYPTLVDSDWMVSFIETEFVL